MIGLGSLQSLLGMLKSVLKHSLEHILKIPLVEIWGMRQTKLVQEFSSWYNLKVLQLKLDSLIFFDNYKHIHRMFYSRPNSL